MYFRFPILLLLIMAGLTALIVFKGKLDDMAASHAANMPVQSSIVASSEELVEDKVTLYESSLQTITSKDLRAHVDFLADDLLEGRDTASRGIKLAALYIVNQFKKFGIKGAGPGDSFFQPVEFYRKQVSAACEFKIEIDGEMVPLKYGQDFVVAIPPKQHELNLVRELVFAGFGIQAEEYDYDDFENLDVTGKATVYVTGEPGSGDDNFFAGSKTTVYGSSSAKRKTAKRLGADVVIGVIRPELFEQISWAGVRRFYEGGKISLKSSASEDDFVAIVIHPRAAELLFAGTEQTFAAIDTSASQGQAHSFEMNKKCEIRIIHKEERTIDNNVAGLLEGSDPDLKSEIVVFTAHYDHVGIGAVVKGDSVYNGAADNASGVAGLIELAEAFATLPQPPKRSLLFLALTAEEKGLLGSKYYVNHPIFPLSETVADFNLDMVGIGDTTGIVVYGLERSSLGKDIKKAASHVGLKILPDELPEERIFYRSDHYNFAKKGVPAIMPSFGLNREWFSVFTTFYHQPSDDVNLVYFDFNFMKKMVQVTFLAGLWVADASSPPTWTPGDEFEKMRAK